MLTRQFGPMSNLIYGLMKQDPNSHILINIVSRWSMMLEMWIHVYVTWNHLWIWHGSFLLKLSSLTLSFIHRYSYSCIFQILCCRRVKQTWWTGTNAGNISDRLTYMKSRPGTKPTFWPKYFDEMDLFCMLPDLRCSVWACDGFRGCVLWWRGWLWMQIPGI